MGAATGRVEGSRVIPYPELYDAWLETSGVPVALTFLRSFDIEGLGRRHQFKGSNHTYCVATGRVAIKVGPFGWCTGYVVLSTKALTPFDVLTVDVELEVRDQLDDAPFGSVRR